MSDVKQRKQSKKVVDSAVETDNLKVGGRDEPLIKTPSTPSMNAIFEKPCHESQDSLLSGSSGYTNYRGFFNLSLILLFLSNARVALENIIKYGILIDPVSIVSIFLLKPHKSPVFYLILMINLYILPCVYVEKQLFFGKITQKKAVIFYIIDATCMLLLPALVIFMTEPNPYGASLCLTFHSIAFLKIISYAHVNHWYRTQKSPVEKRKLRKPSTGNSDRINEQLVQYPENLTIGDMYYFLVAPTLCYDLNFPRNPRIRKLFVMKRLFEVIFLFQIILALNQQWIVPLLKNSLQPFISMDYGRILERLLKLAIPNHVIWLLAFYWLFHSFLNLVAELLRFADRRFYNDWWNAETVQYFWQNWNMPVHKWCVRHLYVPMVSHGYGKVQASCTVFLVSAFFHEYLISIPLHLFRLWSFSGMLAQIPLNILTKYFFKGRAGNIVVWLSLILGQPLAILMYVHDWYVVHYIRKNGAGFTANSTLSY